MITYQLEHIATFLPDFEELKQEHYKEIGSANMTLHLNIPLYQSFEVMGNLTILTVREDGKMIGYVVVFVKQHPHYAELCGFEDGYFLTASARRSGVGRVMFEKTLERLKARGVKRAYFHSKMQAPHRGLFTALGFEHSDEIWMRKL